LASYGISEGAVLKFTPEIRSYWNGHRNLAPGMMDIGTFGQHEEAPLRELLLNESRRNISDQSVKELVHKLGANIDAQI
jgi:hypothetical protein